MSIGDQLQMTEDGINKHYKSRFIHKTQKLLDDRVNETYTFIDASLTFHDGNSIWRHELPRFDLSRPRSPTNPLMKTEIPTQSAEHAYELFKEYFRGVSFAKRDGFQRGIKDLERYCSE